MQISNLVVDMAEIVCSRNVPSLWRYHFAGLSGQSAGNLIVTALTKGLISIELLESRYSRNPWYPVYGNLHSARSTTRVIQLNTNYRDQGHKNPYINK